MGAWGRGGFSGGRTGKNPDEPVGILSARPHPGAVAFMVRLSFCKKESMKSKSLIHKGEAVLPTIIWLVLMAASVWAQDADGYYGVLNANPALIDSISNESGTLTGDFSTQSLLGPVEHAQWATEGPVVVSASGEVLGTLSTVETNTHSIFNETIYVQIPYTDRCEACIGSLNDNFSTVGPKIYDSQSSELKDKIGEVIGAPLQENP